MCWPSICEGDDTFDIVFRYPSQVDLLKLASISSDNSKAIDFVNSLFVDFVNKPELIDEDGKGIDYKDFGRPYGLRWLTANHNPW